MMTTPLLRTALAALLVGAAPIAGADTLTEVYQRALEHDTTWRAAQAGARATREQNVQGRSLLLPTVTANANFYKYDQDVRRYDTTTGVTTSENSYRYDSKSYGVQLVQPLWRAQNFAARAQGRIAVNQADAELAIARQELILRVAQAYFDVLAAQDALDFARTEKSAIRGQMELARRNFAVGNASVVDVHEAKARFDLASAQEVAAEADLQAKLDTLTALVGNAPGALARLAAKIDLPPPDPANADDWIKAAGDQNLQLKLQEYKLATADEELRKSRGGHAPTLDLIAAHSWSDTGGGVAGFGSETTTNQVGVQLNVPLYQGGYVSSKTREASERREQAFEGVTQARRDTTRKTREAWLAVTSGAARVQALELALVSSQKALESTLIGYESGRRTGVEVLNSQRDFYRTQRDLSQARYAWLMGRLRLKAAAGTLNDNDLAEINTLLTGQ